MVVGKWGGVEKKAESVPQLEMSIPGKSAGKGHQRWDTEGRGL